MPKISRKIRLTDKAVDKLKAAAGERLDYTDLVLPAFRLRVSGPTPRHPEGAKTFSLLYRYGVTQKRLSLGAYPAVSLADARAQAREALQELDKGQDPAARKEQVRSAAREQAKNTVEAVLGEFIKRHLEAKHRAPRYIEETRRNFELHVLPRWRGRALADITRRDVMQLLDEIADRGTPIAANRTRAAISAMCNFAIRRSVIEQSPCALVERPGKETARDRVLITAELRAVWLAAGDLAYPWGAYFRLLLATGQRRQEVATMRWSDLDLDDKLWLIPSAATKANRAHAVPLSALAVQLLAECPRRGAYVFSTGPRRRRNGKMIELGDAPISGYSKAKAALDRAIIAAGIAAEPWTPHDLRRTAATMMGKLGVSRFIQKRILNHADGEVTGIYDCYEYLPEKRQALESWAQFLDNLTNPPGANVVPLRAEA